MKRLNNWLVIICLVLLAGCAAKSNDPKKVLTDFLTAMQKKDFTKAEKLATVESKEYFINVKKLDSLSHSPYLQDSNYFNNTKIVIGAAAIENQLAHIPVQVKIKDSMVTPVYTLKQEGGEWKVAFDYETQASLKQPGK